MIQANKKDFIFRQGTCTMNVLDLFMSKSFALNICSKDPMKNSTLGYFCKITYSQMHRKFQPCMMSLWKMITVFHCVIWNFLSLHYIIVCIGVSPPLPCFVKPPLNWQTVQGPLFMQSLSLYWFFVNPPPPAPKTWSFQWTPKILKFFILNTILSFKSN